MRRAVLGDCSAERDEEADAVLDELIAAYGGDDAFLGGRVGGGLGGDSGGGGPGGHGEGG